MIESAAYGNAYASPAARANIPGEGGKGLTDYLKMFDDFRNTKEENRRQQAIDIAYYHGRQLTREEKQVLSERGQPDIVINRTRTAVNGIIGVIIQSKADPRCWPRTPMDEDSADVATDVLRYVAETARFTNTKGECFWDMLVPGVGAAIIEVNEDGEIVPTQIRQEEYFYDPRARRRDKKDALYHGIAKWMYAVDVEAAYDVEIALSFSSTEGVGGAVDSTFEDRPRDQGGWLDIRNRRVMVVELYYRVLDTWRHCVYYAGGVLLDEVSPYNDGKGRPCCPIEAMTCYVDDDNNDYGVVRDMRDIQDEINKRRSKLLHLLSTHQIQAKDPAAIEVNADEARAEAAKPDGVIPFGWEVVRTTDMSAGQSALLSEAKNEMERMGPNPAVLGRQGSDTSGRALLARQQAGLVELALQISQLDDWELRVYKQCWWRAQQYWKEEQYIRVTDDQDSPKFVLINAPKQQPLIDPTTGQPVMDPATGQPFMQEPQFDENGDSVFGYDNKIAEMDVDIIVDTQPETANIMQEMVQDLIKLVAASPQYAAQVPFEIFLELSPIPHKRRLMDKIKVFKAEQQKQQQDVQKAQFEGELRKLAAEIEKLKSEAFKNMATGQAALAKVGAETQETGQATEDAAMVAQEAFESEQERLHKEVEAELDRAHEAEQAELDRNHELVMKSAEMAHEAEQSSADREERAFEASQSAKTE